MRGASAHFRFARQSSVVVLMRLSALALWVELPALISCVMSCVSSTVLKFLFPKSAGLASVHTTWVRFFRVCLISFKKIVKNVGRVRESLEKLDPGETGVLANNYHVVHEASKGFYTLWAAVVYVQVCGKASFII